LLAFLDWAGHLAVSPGKRLELAQLAIDQFMNLTEYIACAGLHAGGESPEYVTPRVTDRRFAAEEWHCWPFNIMQQSFRLTEQWWAAATTGVWGYQITLSASFPSRPANGWIFFLPGIAL
jgi:polyhydroxyalkanoate synthase